ncbi:MAG TPA: response regulator, partial [Hyphomicrobiales bacterium]
MREGSRATSAVSAAEEPIVFVIDDDPLTYGALSSLFRSIGLRVEAFASATEFLQHELPAVPSYLVLDIRLPQLNGRDMRCCSFACRHGP